MVPPERRPLEVVSRREYRRLKFIGGPFVNQTARRPIGLAVIQTRKKVP
jgi:hypothetical protein